MATSDDKYTTTCRRCENKLAKNDDARREDEDGTVYYLCDDCIEDDNQP